MKIVFDTNFCLVPFEFKVDVVSEIQRIMPESYEIIIPNLVIGELEKLSRGTGKRAIAAKSALEFARQFKIVRIEKQKTVDESIVYFTKKINGVLATQDKEMKKLARKLGIPIITMRQKKYLIYDGEF